MTSDHAGAAMRHIRKLIGGHPADDLTDAELVRRFAETHDEDAFAVLLQRHGPLVWGVCRGALPTEQDAEDAFQATFLVLARRAAAIRKREALASWLFGVARRVSLKARQRAALRLEHERRAAAMKRSEPSADLNAWELQALLADEVARLPEKYRAPFVLCCLEGRSREEAVRELGWPRGTVASRLAQARKLLQQRLARRGVSLALLFGGASVAPASPSAVLLDSTRKAALRFAAGVGPHDGVSDRSLSLARGALRGTLPGRLWLGVLVLMLGAVVGYRLSAGGPRQQGGGEPAPPSVEGREPVADPLPAGVRARLGLLRLRHGDFVNTASFSPDGKLLASGGRDGLVRLWEVPTGKELRRFAGRAWPVSSVLFSADGKTLVSADLEGSISFWDVRTGRERHCINQAGREFSRLRLSPDGRTVAAASCTPTGIDSVLHLWDLASGKEIRQIKAYPRARIAALAFSPDGKQLVSAPTEQELHLWDIASGKQVRSFEVKRALISDVAFCGDGKTIVGLSGLTGTLLSWDLSTGKVRHRVETEITQIGAHLLSFGLLPGGRTLLALRIGGVLTTHDAITLKELRRCASPDESARKLILSRDGKLGAFLTGDNSIALVRADSGKGIGPRGGHQGAVHSLAWSADGKLLVTAGDNTPVVWDAASGKELHRLRGHRGMVSRVAFLADGKTLVSGSQDRSVCFWDAATGKELRRYEAPELLHAVSPGGKLLAALTSGTGEASLVVRQAATGKELRRIPFPTEQGGLSALVFSPDGRTLVAGRAYARKIKRWEVASGKELPAFDFPPRPRSFEVSGVRALAFSPDGKVLASAHHNGTVRLWDAQTGATLRDLSYRAVHTGGLAFSPDGKVLVLAVEDFVVLVEMITGKERGRLRGHQGRVTSLAFSPDGRSLLTGSSDTTALVWDLARAPH